MKASGVSLLGAKRKKKYVWQYDQTRNSYFAHLVYYVFSDNLKFPRCFFLYSSFVVIICCVCVLEIRSTEDMQ